MKLQALVGGAAEVIGSEATLTEAAERMMDREVDCLAVVEGREVAGIVTEYDIVSAVAADVDPDEATVSVWMTESPDTVPPTLTVREAAIWLLETGYRHLPVMDEGELLGVISIKDVLWALVESE
ncbi:MAG: cyclic nucleotide-binding/CBS domain-containing protein [Acidimicrobiia bacterium]